MAECIDEAGNCSLIRGCKNNNYWSEAPRKLKYQPTSASSERAFSFLKYSFSDRQDKSLLVFLLLLGRVWERTHIGVVELEFTIHDVQKCNCGTKEFNYVLTCINDNSNSFVPQLHFCTS